MEIRAGAALILIDQQKGIHHPKLDPKATMEAMNQQFLGMPLQGAYWIDGKAK